MDRRQTPPTELLPVQFQGPRALFPCETARIEWTPAESPHGLRGKGWRMKELPIKLPESSLIVPLAITLHLKMTGYL
ncbi:hypothetical protein DL769_007522 [Monosporascus sp. CRB-8-3]|nr:hypothetical protein DL769_007522 [Monosporascus sp. CRB-8-3]